MAWVPSHVITKNNKRNLIKLPYKPYRFINGKIGGTRNNNEVYQVFNKMQHTFFLKYSVFMFSIPYKFKKVFSSRSCKRLLIFKYEIPNDIKPNFKIRIVV